MPEPIFPLPPRIIVMPDPQRESILCLSQGNMSNISFRACCKDPSPGVMIYDNGTMTGYVIYCESCDHSLLRILWSKADMDDYRKWETPEEARIAYLASADEYHTLSEHSGTLYECSNRLCQQAIHNGVS